MTSTPKFVAIAPLLRGEVFEMRITTLTLWLAATTLLACSKGGNESSDAGAGGSSGSSTKSGTGSSGTKSDAGTSATKSGGGTAVTPLAPGAILQNIGRRGESLQFTVQGYDAAGHTTEAHIQMLDAAGSPVTAFDTNWDGVADSAEQLVHFDASTLGQQNFTQTITLTGMFGALPTIASAVVSFSDIDGNLAPALTAKLGAQAVVALGGKCDPKQITNRCATGLSCGGTASTCQASVAPSLTQVAYYGGTSPSQFFVGTDPDQDLTGISVSFLDATGKSIAVDLVGDGDTVSQALLDARTTTASAFTFANYPANTFTQSVPKISAVATDSLGHTSAAVTASLTTQPTHSNGGTCDVYGVTGCVTGSVCSPGIVGAANTCASLTTLETAKCTTAPATATEGKLAAWGIVQGVSLWDPPTGCVFATEINRPESLVTLKLTQNVSQLTLSTAVPETDFDTILYVFPSCPTGATKALACNDDAQGSASTVTLTDVPAGTYTVVIDSATQQGGHFGLSVVTQ